MAATVDIPAGGYRYIPFAFQYSGGVEALAGLSDRAGDIREPLPLEAGFSWIERLLRQRGPATRGFLCLRAALAGTIHRHGLHRIQPPLHRHAAAVGRDEERGRQSCGPQQRHPATAQAGRTQLLRVLLRASALARRDRSSLPAAARLETERRRIASARFDTVRPAPTPCVRKRGSCRDGWTSGWPHWARPGPTPRPRRLQRCTTSTLICRRDRAARRGAAWAGVALCPSTGRRPGIRDGLSLGSARAQRHGLAQPPRLL